MTKPDNPQTPNARRQWLATSVGAIAASALQPGMSLAAAPARRTPTAQATEGPYYFDARQVRADIATGLPGVPLELRFAVVDTVGEPLAGARVDVWHCNAAGLYSGYAGQGDDGAVSTIGQTFLRGTQAAGTDGVAVFRSVYPGWYRGRTTHIHFKVFSAGRTLLTSQFFLPDTLSEFLYSQLPAYRRQGLRDTLNSNDGIALMAGETVMGSVREAKGRYVASLDLVVDRNATPQAEAGPGGRPGRPGGPPPGGPGGPPPGGPGGPGRSSTLTPAQRLEALLPGTR